MIIYLQCINFIIMRVWCNHFRVEVSFIDGHHSSLGISAENVVSSQCSNRCSSNETHIIQENHGQNPIHPINLGQFFAFGFFGRSPKPSFFSFLRPELLFPAHRCAGGDRYDLWSGSKRKSRTEYDQHRTFPWRIVWQNFL